MCSPIPTSLPEESGSAYGGPMRIAALRQRDGTTCGPSVAVMAGALLDPSYGAEPTQEWFAREQGRVHARINRVWPRMLGTTPMGMARAITVHSRERAVRYRWRLWRGRSDGLADVLAVVDAGWPVAMLVGRLLPRHWVLIVDVTADRLRCYEPSSGEMRSVELEAVRCARMTGVGYPRVFALVLPKLSTRSATA